MYANSNTNKINGKLCTFDVFIYEMSNISLRDATQFNLFCFVFDHRQGVKGWRGGGGVEEGEWCSTWQIAWKLTNFFFFKKKFVGHMSICGATDTPVSDFW